LLHIFVDIINTNVSQLVMMSYLMYVLSHHHVWYVISTRLVKSDSYWHTLLVYRMMYLINKVTC